MRCRHAGALEVFPSDNAAWEIHLGKADAAHPTALDQFRLEIFTDHQFGRTAADVYHQLTAFLRLRMFHAHKNQSGFFVTGNNFDRVGDDLFCALEKIRGI